jgi:uncharacterized protein YecT (DUF1311 family)
MSGLGSLLSNLSDKQVAVLVALASFAGAMVVLLFQGAGFLIRRWWTGEGVHERVTHLSSLADLRAKMQAGGMTLKDIQELEASLTTGELSTVIEAGVQAVADENENLPQRYWTTVAMRVRAAARLDLLDAELNEILTDLGTLLHGEENDALMKAQRAWLAYRKREMRYGASGPGTIAPLIGFGLGISATSRRIEQMREETSRRKKFGG